MGFATEYSAGSLFALESEISVEYTKYNFEIVGSGSTKRINLDAALNLKFHFNSSKKFYAKVGYFINENIRDRPRKMVFSPDFFQSGLQLGVGYNFEFINSSKFRIEPTLRFTDARGLHGGLKLGYTF